jgi:hypothetical protein
LATVQADEKTRALAPAFSGGILSVAVDAKNLGIVLDISESMNRALPAVRAALREKVPHSPVVHVDGCSLEKPAPRAAMQNGIAPEPVTAFIALAEKVGVDTIFWNSDQGDPHVRDGIIALEEALTKHKLRLIMVSLKNKPNPSLRKLTEGSRGKWAVVQAAN